MKNLEIFGIPFLKKGKGIHIKKENRGKFTDYCGGEVTLKCIDKAKRSGNPKLVKRAVFAENAKKFKHQKGGTIRCDDGTILQKSNLTKDQLSGRTSVIIKGKKLYVRGDGTAGILNHKPGLLKLKRN